MLRAMPVKRAKPARKPTRTKRPTAVRKPTRARRPAPKTKSGRPRPKLNAKDKLRWAAQLGYRDIVEELLAKGQNPNVEQAGSTPLAMACFHRNIAIVRALLAGGADPNFRAATGSAPIVYAVTSGSKRTIEMVQMLLDAGADPNPPSYRDLSLIEWCSRDPRLAGVKDVLESAAAEARSGTRTSAG
jgi:ankyrin repeat protein